MMQILIQVMSILQTPTAVLSGSDIRAPLFSPLTTDISSEEDIQDNYEGHCLTSETADGTPEEITQGNS